MENKLIENTIKPKSVIDKLCRMVIAMVAFEPVMANIIGISLAVGILLLLNHTALFPKLGKYDHYLTHFVYALIIIQTIKSATKSLFVPLMILVIVGAGYLALNIYPDLQFINIELLKKAMLVGVVGVATSVLVIR